MTVNEIPLCPKCKNVLTIEEGVEGDEWLECKVCGYNWYPKRGNDWGDDL